MNTADIVILAVLALSLLLGLLRGFVSEVLSLACWIAAFWVAWAFGADVAQWYGAWVHEPAARIIAGYVSCFLGVLIVGALLGWTLHKLMDRGGLRGGDRLLGMVFGLARGVLLVTFAVLMLGFTAVPRELSWWQQSRLLPMFANGAGWVAQRLPPEVTHYLEIGGKSLSAVPEIPISTLQQAAGRMLAPAGATTAAPATPSTAGHARGHDSARADVGQ